MQNNSHQVYFSWQIELKLHFNYKHSITFANYEQGQVHFLDHHHFGMWGWLGDRQEETCPIEPQLTQFINIESKSRLDTCPNDLVQHEELIASTTTWFQTAGLPTTCKVWQWNSKTLFVLSAKLKKPSFTTSWGSLFYFYCFCTKFWSFHVTKVFSSCSYVFIYFFYFRLSILWIPLRGTCVWMLLITDFIWVINQL